MYLKLEHVQLALFMYIRNYRIARKTNQFDSKNRILVMKVFRSRGGYLLCHTTLELAEVVFRNQCELPFAQLFY